MTKTPYAFATSSANQILLTNPAKEVCNLWSAAGFLLAEIMSATKLTFGRSEVSTSEFLPISPGGQFLLRRIGVEPREQRCPYCNSLIYTRRHSRCGVCEQVLPAGLLLSGGEAQRVDSLLRRERQRHRAWLNRCNE